jgi:transcriptional regulator with XRE-family HTH domain
MGRLVKAKIDEIAKLRLEGYTQKEVAQRLHLHPRTVRKYDPLHQERLQERSVEDRLSALEEAIRTSWDWIGLLHMTMLLSDLGDILVHQEYECPRCRGKLGYDDDEETYVCNECGHKFSNPCD